MPKPNRFVTGEIADFREQMLADEELKKFLNVKFGPDYVEVICGSVRWGYGEVAGRLRVSFSGQFMVHNCDCGCSEPELTPVKFDRHWNLVRLHDWKNTMWVMMDDGCKPKVGESALIKYYRHASNVANWEYRQFHIDDFVRCSSCNKNRRFNRGTRTGNRFYHMAIWNKNWTCADWRSGRRPSPRITCDDKEEEDEVTMGAKVCPAEPNCEGCSSCICLGCVKCRFLECDCRACVDFMYYEEP